MAKYSCEICLKEFLQKNKYETHKKRKTPCINATKEDDHKKDDHKEEEPIINTLKAINYSNLSYKLTKEIS